MNVKFWLWISEEEMASVLVNSVATLLSYDIPSQGNLIFLVFISQWRKINFGINVQYTILHST